MSACIWEDRLHTNIPCDKKPKIDGHAGVGSHERERRDDPAVCRTIDTVEKHSDLPRPVERSEWLTLYAFALSHLEHSICSDSLHFECVAMRLADE